MVLGNSGGGQYFGERRCSTDRPFGDSDDAEELRACWRSIATDFLDFVKKSPAASVQIMGELAERIRQTNAPVPSQVSRNVLEEAEERSRWASAWPIALAAFGGLAVHLHASAASWRCG